MKGVVRLNKAFGGDKREDFFRALISLTESGQILWECSGSATALEESKLDANFYASYRGNQLSLSSSDGKPQIVIISHDGEQAKIRDEADTLLTLYDLVYNSQFLGIKHSMNDIIAEAESLSRKESITCTGGGM